MPAPRQTLRPVLSDSGSGDEDDWFGESSSEDEPTVQVAPVVLNVLCRLCCHISLWSGNPVTCSFVNQPHRMFLNWEHGLRCGVGRGRLAR